MYDNILIDLFFMNKGADLIPVEKWTFERTRKEHPECLVIS